MPLLLSVITLTWLCLPPEVSQISHTLLLWLLTIISLAWLRLPAKIS